MTNQETFNIVYRHLLTQNEKSESLQPCTTDPLDKRVSSQCAYRGEAGRKCAAGVLIPDDEYRSDMEGECANTFNGTVKGVLEKNGHDPDFAQRLQAIHDRFDPCDWGYKLREFAGMNNLTIPEM